MCWAAIASGEVNCKCCDGYTTCPNSTVWEDEDWEDMYFEYRKLQDERDRELKEGR